MVSSATATSVEILTQFLGINLVRSAAPVVIRRYVPLPSIGIWGFFSLLLYGIIELVYCVHTMLCWFFDSFQVSSSPVVSGPLWTGPLHDAAYVTEMLNLAEQWGWVGSGKGTDLEKLLKLMVDESDPRLSFGYIKLDEVLLQNCFHKLYECDLR